MLYIEGELLFSSMHGNALLRYAYSHCKADICLFLASITIFCLTANITTLRAQSTDFAKALELTAEKDFENALPLLQKALPVILENEDWSQADHCIKELANCWYRMKQLDSLFAFAKRTLPQLPFIIADTSIHIGYVHTYVGSARSKQRQYELALQSYDKSRAIFSKQDFKGNFAAFSYKNAAQVCERQLNYQKQYYYLSAALKADTTRRYSASIYASLLNYYQYQNKPSKALEAYEMGIPFCRTSKDSARLNISGAGLLYSVAGKKQLALSRLQQAIRYFSSKEKSGSLLEAYRGLASIARQEQNWEVAEQHYQTSLSIASKHFKQGKDRELAKLYHELVGFYLDKGDLEQALHNCQLAIIQVFPNFDSTDISDNPGLEDIPMESWAMTSTATKAFLLQKLYKEEQDLNLLQDAAHCYQLSFAVKNKLEGSYDSEDAKLYMSEYKHADVEAAIHVNYLLYKKTNHSAHVDEAFALMEQNRAAVLAQAIQQNIAMRIFIADEHLLQRAQQLKAGIAKARMNVQSSGMHEEQADVLLPENPAKLALQEELYRQFVDSVYLANPKWQIPAKAQSLKLDEAQSRLSKLAPNGQILSYFLGDQNSYLISIRPDEASCHLIASGRDLQDQIQELLQEFRQGGKSMQKNPKPYIAKAFALYQNLYRPFVAEGVEQVFVIPDKTLCFVPFDALVVDSTQNSLDGSSAFLLKQQQISYASSASLLLTDGEPGDSRPALLALAPLFEQQHLPPLPYTREELRLIKQHYPSSNLLISEQANVGAFRQQAANFDVLHLATHADIESASGFPRIEFIDSSLYLPELYAMNFKADLVVLSACETGLGALRKGEGAMSLARGFSYGGSKHLLSSLWKVNDRASSSLFGHFYESYSKGINSAEALHAAKLRYLETADLRNASPFYWAGFICMHNAFPVSQAIQNSSNSQSIFLLFAALLAVVLALYLWHSGVRPSV